MLMNEANVNRYVEQKAGVYGLFENMPDDKYYFRYAGQSADLRTRLLQHLADSEPNACIKQLVRGGSCTFGFAYVGTQAERDAIEKGYRENWDLKCNKV